MKRFPNPQTVFATAILLLLGLNFKIVTAQSEISVSGYNLLAVNQFEEGYSYYPGYLFKANNIYAVPALNSKGKSLVRYYKINSKGLIKFKKEEDIFVPSGYELTGSLSFSPDKLYFVFSGMNGTTREPDMYFAKYNPVWEHYNIRLLGELNEYGAIEKNPCLGDKGNQIFYLVKGQVIMSDKKPDEKVFGFPDKIEFSDFDNKEVEAIDIAENSKVLYVLRNNIIYTAEKQQGRKFKIREEKTGLSYTEFKLLGFNMAARQLILFVKTDNAMNKPELIIFKK